MPIDASKIVRLLDKEHPPEIRGAAVTVLGELGIRDAEITTAVVNALADGDSDVRLRAIRAAGKLRIDKALPHLAERLKHGGPEGEAAAESAAKIGPKGTALLREMLGKVVPGLRRYIAASLARAALAGGDELDILTDKDPQTVDAAVTALTTAIPTLDIKQRQRLADSLIKIGTGRKTRLSPQSEAGVMRLAGLLDDERVAPLLWERVLPPHPIEARVNSLQALGKWVKTIPAKEERDRLFQCAADADFRVAAPALMILDRLPASEKLAPSWIALLRAPDIAARRVAMNKVGDRDDPEVVDALLDQVRHPDRGYRQEVLDRLGNTERGRKGLGKLLKETESSDDAWALAKTLVPHVQARPDEWMDELFPVAAAHIEAGADQRANPVLFALREGSTAGLRDRLEKRALTLLKKGQYETAHALYRVLARDPAIGFPIRLGMAACGLKVSPKELDEAARSQDHALHHFANVAAQDQPAVVAYLQQTAWLDAEDLYYLGFHFAESTGALSEFGAEVLQLLIKKYGRTKLAQAAKNKLKSIN